MISTNHNSTVIFSYILDTQYDNVVLAKAMHYLIPPRPISTTGVNFTATMEDSQKSFYQFATGLNNLEEKMSARKVIRQDKNIDPHPIIFGVNFDSKVRYVVVMEELRFYFDELPLRRRRSRSRSTSSTT